VFRRICGTSPTEYRYEVLRQEPAIQIRGVESEKRCVLGEWSATRKQPGTCKDSCRIHRWARINSKLNGKTNKLGCLKARVTIHIAGSQLAAKEPLRSAYDAWVQVWVQLKKEKWLPISRKRHQIGHLDFRSFRLLTF